MKNEFEIEITCSGTKEDIIKSLERFIVDFEEQNESVLVEMTFDDGNVAATIKEL